MFLKFKSQNVCMHQMDLAGSFLLGPISVSSIPKSIGSTVVVLTSSLQRKKNIHLAISDVVPS